MPNSVEITIALDRYDRHFPFFDGTVKAPEEFRYRALQVGQSDHLRDGTDRHGQMIHNQAFDVSEFSMSTFLMAIDRGLPLIGIPVFPRRLFSQSCMFVRADSDIEHPRDLVGRRVGLSSFQTTLSLLACDVETKPLSGRSRAIHSIRFLDADEGSKTLDKRIADALHPSRAAIAAMPISTNVKIANEELKGLGPRVIDLGCGEGKFTRGLTSLFSDVIGLDVKGRKIDQAAEKARELGVNVTFIAASAEKIPFDKNHFDAVIFSNSLHHMPDPASAMTEALRVLRQGGLLYVMEPVPSGNYHDATCLVNDETIVRTQAYEAILRVSDARPVKEILYRAPRTFDNFEEWRDDQIDRDPKRQAFFDADPDTVRKTFEGNAERRDGKLVFDQVFRVNILRKL